MEVVKLPDNSEAIQAVLESVKEYAPNLSNIIVIGTDKNDDARIWISTTDLPTLCYTKSLLSKFVSKAIENQMSVPCP